MKYTVSELIEKTASASIIFLLPCAVFSYLPVISIGVFSGMHFDISFLYIITLIAVTANIPLLARSLRQASRSQSWKFLAIFTSYSWISALWSPNQLRALVTALFMTILLLLCSIILLRYAEIIRNKSRIIRLCVLAFGISGLFALWQIIGDILKLPTLLTGLPVMYSGDVFGIARPTAFALEPQFFGSLLLLPLIWSAWHIHIKSPNNIQKYIIFTISVLLLLLTLSRGAIAAACIGYLVLIISTRPPIRIVAKTLGMTLMASILAIALIFTAGTLRHDTISGQQAVQRTINQLSLGVIDLSPPQKVQTSKPKQGEAQSSGYISTSTDSRLSMGDKALLLWRETPGNLLFGVGIGGFGASISPSNPGIIVNNYYIELLVETGLVGAVLFASFIITLFWGLIRQKQWLPIALLASLLIQLHFFSGNGNIIHVWILIGLSIGSLYVGRKHLKKSVS